MSTPSSTSAGGDPLSGRERRQRSSAGTTRVLLADPDPLARRVIAEVLAADPRVELLAETGCPNDAVVLVSRYQPCILLLADWFPGERSAIDVLAELRSASPATRIVMLVLSTDPGAVVAALRAGAGGCLVKERQMGNLTAMLRRFAVDGVAPLSPALTESLLEELRHGSHAGERRGTAGLTPREQEVLRFVALGYSNAEIGRRLSVSPATVKSHVHNLLEKLHVRSRVQLALRARLILAGGHPPVGGNTRDEVREVRDPVS